MRTDVEFSTEDRVMLRGWHYRPDRGRGPWPTIVMAHGFSAVKEMYLDRFAEVFAAAGLAALVFDNRNFGASESRPGDRPVAADRRLPRRDQLRADAARDRRPAHRGLGLQLRRRMSWCSAPRIGAWCVASQVPLISGYRNARRLIRADVIAAVEAMCAEDRLQRYRGEPPATLPVVSEDPAGPRRCRRRTWQWFTEAGRCGRLPGRTS